MLTHWQSSGPINRERTPSPKEGPSVPKKHEQHLIFVRAWSILSESPGSTATRERKSKRPVCQEYFRNMHAMLRSTVSIPLETHISNLMILRFAAQHYGSARASWSKNCVYGVNDEPRCAPLGPASAAKKVIIDRHRTHRPLCTQKDRTVHILSPNSFLSSTILPGKVSRKLVVSARKRLLRKEVGGRDGASVRSSFFDASLPTPNKTPLKFSHRNEKCRPNTSSRAALANQRLICVRCPNQRCRALG